MPNNLGLLRYINHFVVEEDFYLEGNIFNFTKLLEMVLQTSGDHDSFISQKLGISFLNADESWVITQNHFHVLDYPSIGSPIEIETRVSNANRFFVDRWFGVKVGQNLLMEFQIQYTIINLTSRKMARIPAKKLEEHSLIDNAYYLVREKIMHPDDLISYSITPQKIVPGDIDMNQHVNNMVYIRWGAKAMPIEILSNFSIKKAAIKYGSEILPDHQVGLETRLPANIMNAIKSSERLSSSTIEYLESFQVIRNETTKQDACLLHLTWTRNI